MPWNGMECGGVRCGRWGQVRCDEVDSSSGSGYGKVSVCGGCGVAWGRRGWGGAGQRRGGMGWGPHVCVMRTGGGAAPGSQMGIHHVLSSHADLSRAGRRRSTCGGGEAGTCAGPVRREWCGKCWGGSSTYLPLTHSLPLPSPLLSDSP